MTNHATLYVVATPIGNTADISLRAIDTLRAVAYIAAEDTRHSKRLLEKYAVDTPMLSLHDHNETQQTSVILDYLHKNASVALISDAGTPLISDPGYVLVNAVRDAGFNIVAIPGPSAIITALSIAGMPTQPFTFWGFLPAKLLARQTFLEKVKMATQTGIFYESTHRLIDTLHDIINILGAEREIAVAKELTKKHENIIRGAADQVCRVFLEDQSLQKGEFVIIVKGLLENDNDKDAIIDQHLCLFMSQLTVKQAVKFTVELTGANKNKVYERALQLQNE